MIPEEQVENLFQASELLMTKIDSQLKEIQKLFSLQRENIKVLNGLIECFKLQKNISNNFIETNSVSKDALPTNSLEAKVVLPETPKRRGRPPGKKNSIIRIHDEKEKKRYLTQVRRDLIVKSIFEICENHKESDSVGFYNQIKSNNPDLIVHNFSNVFANIMDELVDFGFFELIKGSEEDVPTEPKLLYRHKSGDFDAYQNRVSVAS